MVRKLLHRIAHLFGLNGGHVVTAWKGRDLWVGFQCEGCGRIQGAHKIQIRRDVPVSED